MNTNLLTSAKKLYSVLIDTQHQVVFAESCTGGLIAATLAQLSGVSQYLCGSAVVYQIETKTAWLNVSAECIKQHDVVSLSVAEEMAMGVLEKTAQATVAASITGHLGPDAPPQLDGVVCIGIASRNKKGKVINQAATTQKLIVANNDNLRSLRQQAAAALVMQQLSDFLADQ